MPADFYQVLGVPRDATERDISSAYRKLARRYHPDVTGGDRDAEERFKEINAAHAVLSDDDKRAAYDKWGDQWEHADQLEEMQRQHGGGFGGFSGGQHFGNGPGGFRVEFGEGGFEDILGGLGEMFGGRTGRHGDPSGPRTPPHGRDIEHPLTVSLREAFHGTTRMIQRGHSSGGGRIEVTIPPGVDTGSRIKISGKGEDSPYVGQGLPGDLYLLITVDGDPVFSREGDDLRVIVEVPVTTAALGGEAVVRTITGGGLALTIPPGTQSGRTFRLNGQGMPRFKRDGRGDILAEVTLILPDPLTEQQHALFQQLRDLDRTEDTP